MMEMDFESQQTAQAQLEPGERLLWHGKPDPKRGLLATIPLVLFAIPWTGFSVFWMAAASGLFFDSEPGWMSLFELFGVPFVLIGLGMLTSPYWLYKKAKLTVYALTNRRAMIITGRATKKVQSFAASDMGLIERTERRDGRGEARDRPRPGYPPRPAGQLAARTRGEDRQGAHPRGVARPRSRPPVHARSTHAL